MLVTNVNGSGRFKPPKGYTSWLQYWERQTGKKAFFCSALYCKNSNLAGAHVQKAYSTDKKWYIIPLCISCNGKSSKDVFEVLDLLVPVPSNL